MNVSPQALRPTPHRGLPIVGAAWGILGTAALLARAIWALVPPALEALTRHQLGALGWTLAVATVGFFGFFEGYRGFQRGFSPRVVARAFHLAARPRPLHLALAPLFCIGLIHASRRRLVASWVLVVAISCAIAAMRLVPQPARGIVDLGVVVGLGWGLVSLLVLAGRALSGAAAPGPVDLPSATLELG